MKSKTVFICSECGYESLRWLGKCPGCGSWNTMVEEIKQDKKTEQFAGNSQPVKLNDVKVMDEERYKTGLKELDRVLGGGIVKGSLILVGGDPGIGKSTLLLQISNSIGKENKTILYISGEESEKQIKIRASRLGVDSDNLYIVSETDIDLIEKFIEDIKPDIAVIDSIQTMYRGELTSAPGSVSQVREATGRLMRIAKSMNVAIFIVGHVTKEGSIAGPRVLEHMVDTVLYFEGERHHTYRILRAVKNRFGSTNEIGIFEMRDTGLVEVPNPSELMLTGRPENVPGNVVVSSIEGTRPVLVELQALVSQTSFGMPRRMATGIDYNRVVLLMAVLEKRAGMQLQTCDAYVNVAGGIKVDEPAVDLGIILSVASSFKNKEINSEMAVMGEVGLTGEVRGISYIEKRIQEAYKLGFKSVVLPKDNAKNIKGFSEIKIYGVQNIYEAL
ncbi:MAG TPA: DNA repair protein RadA, partial [Clostridiaceae bacterium]|nr:DNA repair protein RadA [Clostridiaceae bacterium]